MSLKDKVLGALAPYDVKAQGANQYRLNSPLRAGANSHSFVVTFEGDDHGAWYDHVDDKGGSLYDLAKHLGIEVVKEVATTKRAYSNIHDYAMSHGITSDVLVKAGWKEETKNNRKALFFPTKGGHRWRFLDGNQPYYISVNGYKKCWYGLNEVTQARLAYGEDLTICNGEISTVVGQAYGLATVSVTSGEGAIPDDLLNQLKEFLKPYPNTRIVIALDCDDKGRKSAEIVFGQLKSNGFNVVAVDLGLSKGGDLADFLALYGLDRDGEALLAFKSLKPMSIFEYKPVRRWEIIHASELDNLPPVRWLIKNEIPERSMVVIYGASGAGKSFVAIDYAMRIAQTKHVIYVAGEGLSGYNGRIKAWCAYHGRGMANMYLTNGAVSLLDGKDFEDFIYALESKVKNTALIIVDTLARSMLGGDENSSRDMGQFIERCDMLKARFDCTVMIVHHTNKMGIVERGSGALRGASDMMIRVSDDDDIKIIECTKSKDSAPFPTMYKKLQPVDVGMINEDGESVMPMVIIETDPMAQTDLDGMTRNQRKVLETACEIWLDGFTIAELNETLPEIDRGSLYRIVARLKKLGYIEQPMKRDPYEVTDKAKRLLNIPDVAVVAHVAHVFPKNGHAEKTPSHRKTTATTATTATNDSLFADDSDSSDSSEYFRKGF